MRKDPRLQKAEGPNVVRGLGVCCLEKIGSTSARNAEEPTGETGKRRTLRTPNATESNDAMQLIEFPQDVNSEPHNEMEVLLFEGLTTAGSEPFSDKQAHWLIAVFRGCEWNPQGVAYAIAVVSRGGPDLRPFEASDEELADDAKKIYEEGVAAFLRTTGRLQ